MLADSHVSQHSCHDVAAAAGVAAGALAVGDAAATQATRAAPTAATRQQALQQQAAKQAAAAAVATGAGAVAGRGPRPLLLLLHHPSPSLRQRQRQRLWRSLCNAMRCMHWLRDWHCGYAVACARWLGCCACRRLAEVKTFWQKPPIWSTWCYLGFRRHRGNLHEMHQTWRLGHLAAFQQTDSTRPQACSAAVCPP